MLKLHYHPLSSYSQKALMALYEKGNSARSGRSLGELAGSRSVRG
jgi:glutathione S-transferase